MAAIEIGIDAQSLKVVSDLTSSINALCGMLQDRLKPSVPGADNWLSASHFCEKYDISRSTLTRRVQDGKVERQDFDDGIIRYRMAGITE